MSIQTVLAAVGAAIVISLVTVGLIVMGTTGTDSNKAYVETPSYLKDDGLEMPRYSASTADQKGLVLSEESGITRNDNTVRKIAGVKLSEDGSVSSIRQYINYTEDALIRASSNGGRAVIFFTRADCESCARAERRFEAAQDAIRPRVTVLRADMAANENLVSLYGVEEPHTFVQVDENGKEVVRWTGGDIDTLNERIKMR